MGLTRSPEIAEDIERNRNRIERSLYFLKKLLMKGESIKLKVTVTKKAVVLDPALEIAVNNCGPSDTDSSEHL